MLFLCFTHILEAIPNIEPMVEAIEVTTLGLIVGTRRDILLDQFCTMQDDLPCLNHVNDMFGGPPSPY